MCFCRKISESLQKWRSACGRRSWCPTWVRWTLKRNTRSWRRVIRSLWKITEGSLRGWQCRPDQTEIFLSWSPHQGGGLPCLYKVHLTTDLSCNQENRSRCNSIRFYSGVSRMYSSWCYSSNGLFSTGCRYSRREIVQPNRRAFLSHVFSHAVCEI